MLPQHPSVAARFFQKVSKLPDAPGCWLWTGSVTKKGYGWFNVDGRITKAHRLAYALAFGPIPTGLLVLHRCDTPGCVNPDHLRVGTPRENSADMVARRRQRSLRGEQSAKAKLTEAQVIAIRATTGSHPVVARRFGVARQTIGQIKSRKRWRHVA